MSEVVKAKKKVVRKKELTNAVQCKQIIAEYLDAMEEICGDAIDQGAADGYTPIGLIMEVAKEIKASLKVKKT